MQNKKKVFVFYTKIYLTSLCIPLYTMTKITINIILSEIDKKKQSSWMSTDPVNKINFREKDGGQNALDLLFGAFWDTDD